MRLLEPGMGTLDPQIGPYRIGMGHLKHVISLFSQSADGGRRQYLIFGVENGPPELEPGVKFHLSHPLCERHSD